MLGMTSGADWLIAGLGNPEPKYDGTRHNAGFEALDYLAAQWHCDITKAKWQGLYGTAQVGDHKVVLLKPLTYMNLSGQSIAPAANFYKIPADHVIVLCDDITQEPSLLVPRAVTAVPAGTLVTLSKLVPGPARRFMLASAVVV